MSSTDRRRGALLLAVALSLASLPAARARGEGQNKIVYDSFDWSIYPSTHFRVYHYSREAEALTKVVSMAESAYDELSRRLNYQIPKPIPLIFYATHAEFEQNNVILNFIPEGVGAFAEAARNRMVLPIDLPDEQLQKLIQHELTHIFQYEILYGGRLGRALTGGAPTWFIEGMASYYADDEDDKDKIFLRDAVNSDLIPPISRVDIRGYVAYRYGHAVFDFIEAEWGKDAVREFIFEFRSFLGRDISQAVRRSFEIDAEEFDLRFRRYLRRKYLPLLAQKGEASEYGQRFRVAPPGRGSYEIGAAPSPSGDFVATMTAYKDDVDIALLSTKTRRLWKNLTAGRTTKYEYLTAQFLTMGPESGRDLSFAPDGDRIAVFARRERGRQLFIFSARSGSVEERIPVSPDMPLSPAFSPDGGSVVFSGIQGTSRDIFLLDLATRQTRNLTEDPSFDTGPVYSPDGKWIYHSKVINGLRKIVRFPVDDPKKVEQVTWGDGNDEDPAFSPDAKRLYFSSSRNGGIPNVYGQDLATGEIWQFTDVIGAALGPAAYVGDDGQEKIVFSGFQAQRFALYTADAKKPIRQLDEKALPPAPLGPDATAPYAPALEVAVDPEKTEKVPKFKLFLEDAQLYAGISSDQTFVSTISLSFSDYLGDKRAIFVFDSVAGYSNFRLGLFNLKKRFQWGAQAYDYRQYYWGYTDTGQTVQGKRIVRETGVRAEGIYPLSRYTRLQGNVGFISRSLDVAYWVTNDDLSQGYLYLPRSDDVPTGGTSFSYDAVNYASFGPLSGRRVDAFYQYTPNLSPERDDEPGTLSQDMGIDARMYLPISRRTLFAVRAFGARSDGAAPTVYYFGGLDTLRGYEFRTLIGNRIFYVNTEFRFPLIDVLATGFGINFQGVRGRIFLDVGGAWLADQTFQFYSSESGTLKDGRASYGAGFSVFFLGLPWNFDFARQWDLKNSSDWKFDFYIGWTF